jgi:hypothetical protein
MSTKRTPINRPTKARIPSEAVEMFKRMKNAARSKDWDAWHDLNAKLCPVLGLKPWHFPALAHPDDPCPEGYDAHAWRAMQDRYLQLAAALAESRKRHHDA